MVRLIGMLQLQVMDSKGLSINTLPVSMRNALPVNVYVLLVNFMTCNM